MASLRLEGIQPKILEPVYLECARGELVFVSGHSGSGKSLLLRAVADLDPHAGEVLIDGNPRSAMPAPEWRRRVGLLPAESHWWGDKVGDHFPDPNAPATEGETGAARPQDLVDLLERLGFDVQVLGWQVSRLSTGERQRLALTRLLANGPQALLLDEATANLDPSNRDRVEELVEDYRAARGAAVLWVSHDPEQRRRLDGRRLVIRNARLEPEP
jgi:ABC-type iron transport system FetAB ATPase subunit